ncbi:MAG: hypothetical protein Faunusvirus44_9 [Faunusvirus sp.]|jgi:hypothetical protein|uniref:Ankyrin repeat protein n=1 Tax=Faunusvirus sp. TaxID=2487766 RepID=A0A3G5A2N2_9VIRU|nr:MAG: hypothetical protein Faunusvirus44_9 [Faunusvirus sp.]
MSTQYIAALFINNIKRHNIDECIELLNKYNHFYDFVYENKTTLLMHTCLTDSEQMAIELIKRGANIHPRDKHDCSALLYACTSSMSVAGSMLVDKIDVITFKDTHYRQVFTVACNYKLKTIVEKIAIRDTAFTRLLHPESTPELWHIKQDLVDKYKSVIHDTINSKSDDNALYIAFCTTYVPSLVDIIVGFIL